MEETTAVRLQQGVRLSRYSNVLFPSSSFTHNLPDFWGFFLKFQLTNDSCSRVLLGVVVAYAHGTDFR